MAQKSRCTRSGAASLSIKRCAKTRLHVFLQEALGIARFEPGIYELVQTFVPTARQTETDV
jgi:hypothetical protein